MENEMFVKSMSKQINQIVTKPRLYNSRVQKTKSGYVYTLYRQDDRCLKIGFTQEIELWMKSQKLLGYKLIDSRTGTSGEEKLLKATLNELGYIESISNKTFMFSVSILRHLTLLGWPVGKLIGSKQKTYNKNNLS